ncbi:Putative choline transporter, neither null mutation nor overexpression affects choline transport [Hypoxylon texense]
MFASWKPVANGDGSNALLCKRPHTFDPVTAKTERPVACSQCRAQKVRCTGERNGEGCRRCQSLGKKCTYPPRRCGTTPSEKASGLTVPELARPDPLALPAPAPTEDPGRPVSSASTNRVVHEWIHESGQGNYNPNGATTTGFSNFPLGNEFTRYSSASSALMENCEVQNGGRFGPEQILAGTQTHSVFRGPQQHPTIYSLGASSESAVTESLFSNRDLNQAQTHSSRRMADTPTQATSTSRLAGCQCLHRVVILLDELELLGEPATTTDKTRPLLPVDGILVANRKALRQAEDMLACASCASRVENMVILTFLVSRLTELSCRAMSALLSSSRSSSRSSRNAAGTPPSPLQTADHARAGSASTGQKQQTPATATIPTTAEAVVVSVGAYRLESEAELIAVARVLLRLGLDRLLGLVSTLQGVGRRLGSETMSRRLGVCGRAIGGQLEEEDGVDRGFK